MYTYILDILYRHTNTPMHALIHANILYRNHTKYKRPLYITYTYMFTHKKYLHSNIDEDSK